MLAVQNVDVISGGSGYTSAPTVTVVGTCTIPAQLTAIINSAGLVVSITVDNPGAGYATTPTITIEGGGGTGARAAATMGNDLVRSIKTIIKYDRCEYTYDVFEWQPNTTYTAGSLVRLTTPTSTTVWSANGTVNTSIFITTDWTLVDAGTLSGANRTMGYYLPTANEPGLELPLLIDGISFENILISSFINGMKAPTACGSLYQELSSSPLISFLFCLSLLI